MCNESSILRSTFMLDGVVLKMASRREYSVKALGLSKGVCNVSKKTKLSQNRCRLSRKHSYSVGLRVVAGELTEEDSR